MKIGGESRDRSDVQQFATRTPARRKFPRNPSAIRASRYSRNSNPSTRNASSANPYREGYNILREELYRKSWKFLSTNFSLEYLSTNFSLENPFYGGLLSPYIARISSFFYSCFHFFFSRGKGTRESINLKRLPFSEEIYQRQGEILYGDNFISKLSRLLYIIYQRIIRKILEIQIGRGQI